MTKEVWNNLMEALLVYDAHSACFDDRPPQKWITSNDERYKYTIVQLPEYELSNIHMHGQFAKCINCGYYYSGWDDFRKEYDPRPEKCLICDGNIVKLQENNNFLKYIQE